VVHCTFCGAEERVGDASESPGAKDAGRAWIGLAGCFTVAIIGGMGVYGAWVAVSLARWSPAVPGPAPVEIAKSVQLREIVPPPADPGVSPSELSDREPGGGWFLLDAPGMQGTPADFDFVGNLDWMLGIARAWSTDARIARGFLTGVRADGSLDVSSREDWHVDLRFYSPTLREMARKAAEVSEQRVASEFRIEISRGRVRGFVDTLRDLSDDDPDPPEAQVECSLPSLMAAWKKRGLPRRPTFELALQWVHFPHEGGHWRWMVDGEPDFGHDVDLPPLSPRTCGALRF